MTLEFTKMQGVGNDFVVVDGRGIADQDWSALAIEVCDRKFGIGADGLLVIDFPTNSTADVLMRMFNPDGTPDICGNGMRCVARYAVEHKLVDPDSLWIETLAGMRIAIVYRDERGFIDKITVGMGEPEFDPYKIPMLVGLRDEVLDYPLELSDGTALSISAVSTGSTHAITFVPGLPDDSVFFAVSPLVEHHPQFPERTSLMWCVVDDPTHIRMRIWERGAGETLGCGTGACAAAVAAIRLGYSPAGEAVTIATRGGELSIVWKPGESIEMTGPARTVFSGTYLGNE